MNITKSQIQNEAYNMKLLNKNAGRQALINRVYENYGVEITDYQAQKALEYAKATKRGLLGKLDEKMINAINWAKNCEIEPIMCELDTLQSESPKKATLEDFEKALDSGRLLHNKIDIRKDKIDYEIKEDLALIAFVGDVHFGSVAVDHNKFFKVLSCYSIPRRISSINIQFILYNFLFGENSLSSYCLYKFYS